MLIFWYTDNQGESTRLRTLGNGNQIFTFTANGQVSSYGSHYVKPFISHGDTSRLKVLTAPCSSMVQGMAKRLMKGRLTEAGYHNTHYNTFVVHHHFPNHAILPSPFHFYHFPRTRNPMCMTTFTTHQTYSLTYFVFHPSRLLSLHHIMHPLFFLMPFRLIPFILCMAIHPLHKTHTRHHTPISSIFIPSLNTYKVLFSHYPTFLLHFHHLTYFYNHLTTFPSYLHALSNPLPFLFPIPPSSISLIIYPSPIHHFFPHPLNLYIPTYKKTLCA